MAVKCPADSVVFWPDTAASIPANWTRNTDFDAKYVQGGESGFTAPANGGNASRSFTANAHSHTGNSHDHSFYATSGTGGTTPAQVHFLGTRFSGATHTHATVDSETAVIAYQNVVISINADTTAPPYIKMILIGPDDAEQDIPDGAVCYTDETGLPTGFEKCDGGGTPARPDMAGRYVLGADALGNGGATGGSATYTLTATNHSHQDTSHYHDSVRCGASGGTKLQYPGSGAVVALLDHHYMYLDSEVLSDVSTDAVTFDATTIDPSYVELLGIQNTSGGAVTSLGVILGYIGTEASIPAGWELVNATTDRQIRSTATDGSVGNTGGNDSHTPTTQAHGHTHSGPHNHTALQSGLTDGVAATGGTATGILHGDLTTTGKHNHDDWPVGATGPTMQDATVTIQAADARLSYRTMIFVKRVPYPTVKLLGGKILGGKIAA